MVNILDVMRVKVVVGLAEGAGANALLRFGSMHVSRCLGIVCINPNPAAATMIGGFLVRTKFINKSKLALNRVIQKRKWFLKYGFYK